MRAALTLVLLCAGPLRSNPDHRTVTLCMLQMTETPLHPECVAPRAKMGSVLYLRGGQYTPAPAATGVQDQANDAPLLTLRLKRKNAHGSCLGPAGCDDAGGQVLAPAGALSKMRHVSGSPRKRQASARLPTGAESMQFFLESTAASAIAASTSGAGIVARSSRRQAIARQPKQAANKTDSADTEILCYKCRRSSSSSHQRSIASYCRSPVKGPGDDAGCVEMDDQRKCGQLVCRQCR
jgi:hypothetical protein